MKGRRQRDSEMGRVKRGERETKHVSTVTVEWDGALDTSRWLCQVLET